MQEVCSGCLCAGRKLHRLGDTGFYKLYKQILDEIFVESVSPGLRVCWECRAALRRFHLFKLQVQHCYTEMLWNVPPPSIPPRLNTYKQNNISYPDSPNLQHDSPTHQFDINTHQYDIIADQYETKSHQLDPPTHQFDSLTHRINSPAHQYSPLHSPVKDEVLSPENDMKDEEHCEPETFVNDLSIETIKPQKKSKKKTKTKLKKQKREKSKLKKKSTKNTIQYESNSETELCIDETKYGDNTEQNEEEDRAENVEVESKEEIKDVEKIIEGDETDLEVKVTVESVNENTAGQTDKPQCVECGKVFSSRKTYRYHLNVLHRGQNRHPCPRCGRVYQWKSNLGRHLRTHQAVDSGELYCATCDKSFASVATYRQHLKISKRHVSENDFSYTCDECGKKFVNKTRLRDHIDWEHLNKVKFRCQLCNKAYKCHTSLYVHLQNVHRNRDTRNNLCHVCGKSYQNPAKLKYHITALHSGETPYGCGQCGAAFAWYSSLYRHVREVHYRMKVQPKKPKKSKRTEPEPAPYVNYQT